MPLLLVFVATGCERLRAADAADQPGDAGEAAAASARHPADCLDVTPHEVTFVTVELGVRLEVLDFGGSGETMVLLTGLGDNAHVWDDFAFQFTDFFRVIGITAAGMVHPTSPTTATTSARGRAILSRSSTTSRSTRRSSSATPSRAQS
jgi:hypothetical protein